MTPTMRDVTAASSTIDAVVSLYYSKRYKGIYPNSRQALLWLLSELGEMVAAYMDTRPHLSFVDRALFVAVIALGQLAEMVVRGEKNWIRNNDRKGAHNLRFEVGDTMMMLSVFSQQSGNGEPFWCMAAKMRSKIPGLFSKIHDLLD